MRSNGAVRFGEQRPRVCSVPPFATSAGVEAVELVESTGRKLDDWQKYALWAALGEDERGNWSSFEVALIVARQNGKGDVLMARELAGLYLFGEQLLVHTAHEYKTAAEAFLRIRDVIDNTDDLRRQVRAIRTSHGEEGIELLNGARLRFLARSKGSGRGFTGDLLIADEAMFLDAAPVAALLPTLSARPNPQFWLAGSAGMETSEHLNTVRLRGLAGNDPSLCYLEHSAPEGIDPTDRHGWAQANPALNIRIPELFVEREQRTMPAREFARERLSIWSDQRAESLFDMDLWDTFKDADSDVEGRVWFGISMAGDRSAAAIGASGRRLDGFTHVEVIEHKNGVRWVADRALELQREWGEPVVLDPGSPAGALIPALQEAGVDLTLITTRELGQACGSFYDDTNAGQVRHLGDPVLTTALLSAKQQPMGDAWKFSLKGSGDVSPLLAVSLAKFGLDSDAGNEPANNVW